MVNCNQATIDFLWLLGTNVQRKRKRAASILIGKAAGRALYYITIWVSRYPLTALR